MASKSLRFLLFGEDVSAGRAFQKIAADAEASGARVKKAFLGLGGTKLGLAGVGFGLAEAAKEATKYQSDMLMLHTQAGVSLGEVAKQSMQLVKLGPQVATGADQLSVSLYHVESTGLRGAKALETVKIAAEGAKVGHADLEETTNALTSTIASGIPGVNNMASAMGSLNAIVGAGDMKMQDLNEALGSGVLTIVKGYGLSLNDVGAALATFGDNNIRGADAATMLRMAVQALAVPAAKGATELHHLGLTTTQLRDDMAKGGLGSALEDLNAHLKAGKVSASEIGGVLTEVFGKKAGPGLAVLIGQLERFRQKQEEVARGGKSFGESWNDFLKSNQGQWDQLHARVQSFEIEVGGKLLPVLNDTLGFINHNSTAVLALAGGVLGLKTGIAGVTLAQKGWKAGSDLVVVANKLLGRSAAEAAVEVEGLAAAERDAAVARVPVPVGGGGGGAVPVVPVPRAGGGLLGTTGNLIRGGAEVFLSKKLGDDAISGAGVRSNIDIKKNITQIATTGLALDANGKTIDIWTAKVVQSSGKIHDLTGLLATNAAAVNNNGLAISHLGVTTEGTAHASEASTAAQRDQAAAAQRAAADINAEAQAAVTLVAGLQAVNRQSLDVKGSQLAFLDSVQSLTDGVKQNGTALTDNTAAGRANEEAILGSIKAAQEHAVAMEKAGTSSSNAARHYLEDEDALRKAAYAAGLNRTQVDNLIKTYGGVPKELQTRINVEDAAARDRVAAYQKALFALPKSIQTQVQLNGMSTAEYELDLLARARTVQIVASVGGVQGVRSVGGVQAFASGTDFAPGGWAKVGEQGPEMVYLPRGSRVSNASQTRAGGGGDVHYHVQVNVTQPLASGDQIARAVVPAIAKAVRNGMTRPW